MEIKTLSGIKESFRGKFLLKTSSQAKPELELFVIGKLKKNVKVLPVYVYFGIIDCNKASIDPESLQRTVLVNKIRGEGLRIDKVETSADWITTRIVPSKEEEKYSIIISLDQEKLQQGNFREKVIVHSHCNNSPEKNIVIIEGKVI